MRRKRSSSKVTSTPRMTGQQAGLRACLGFEEVPKELWIQFATLEDFKARERELYDILRTSDGKDHVVLYIRSPKAVKKLAGSWDILVTEALCREIASHFGQQNVKVVEKSIENLGKMN